LRPIICAVLLATLASAACSTMKTVTLDQMSLLGPERVWVTGSDESVVLLYEPKVVRDTLVGYVGKHKEKLPSTGVKQVRVQTAAPTRTAMLVVGLGAGLIGLMVAVSGTGSNQTQITTIAGAPGDCDKHPEQEVCTGSPSIQ
jgi:hypothetical protein